MEGNTSKIRTMAGDLERARASQAMPILPTGRQVPPQSPSPKALPQAMPTGRQVFPSERRQPPAPPVRPVERAAVEEVKEVKKEERKLSEILAEAKKRLEGLPAGKEGGLPKKTLGDIRPSPQPLVTPPPNLPIGEAGKQARPMAKSEPLSRPSVPVFSKEAQKESARETPEEILAARQDPLLLLLRFLAKRGKQFLRSKRQNTKQSVRLNSHLLPAF
ncbi:MAG: hypothetical protein HYS15_02745 [Candidatus Spechtbacteria bacterium]|nr:hypothetical protein [Candidatus Spechtbacteria bacterium]